jgi:uncharacterized delta-60 repeat protein
MSQRNCGWSGPVGPRARRSPSAGPTRLAPASLAESLEARRLFAAGDFDPTFGHSGLVVTSGTVLGLDERNGKTVVVTHLQDPTSEEPAVRAGVVSYARYLADGRRDENFFTDFSPAAGLGRFADAAGLAVQADNAIVVSGQLRDGSPVVWRLRAADGSLDTSFGTGGFCRLPIDSLSPPALAPDGKIVVAGEPLQSHRLAVVRLTKNGKLDAAFGKNGLAATVGPYDDGNAGGDGNAAVVRPDGSVYVAGHLDNEYGDPQAAVVQFGPAGKYLATLLSENPGDYDIADALALSPNGDLYAGITGGGGSGQTYVVRLGIDGSATHFVSASSYTDNDLRLTSIHVSNDGQRVVAFGTYFDPAFDSFAGAAAIRWNADGTLDRSLDGDGVLEDYATFGDLLPDQRFVVAGNAGDTLLLSRRQWGSDGLSVGVEAGRFGDRTLWVEGSAAADTILVTGVPATKTKPAQLRVETRQGAGPTVVRTFDRADVTYVEVDGNAGDDTITVDALGIGAALLGGAGNDRLTGGAARDILYGDAGDDRLFGRGGDDDLTGGAGDDFLDGGLGADYIDGGAVDDYYGGTLPSGVDTVSYADRTRAVSVTLYDNGVGPDGTIVLPNDGEAGEYDEVENVRIILGGSGNDTLRADFNPYPDDPYYTPPTTPVTLRGGAGDDALYGGHGNDVLDGGTGRDKLFGGAGADTFYARDGLPDEVRGGAGRDRANKDPIDALFAVEDLF